MKKDDVLLKKIGLRIKQLREQRNITQEVFFFDTGINVGRIERGLINLGFITLNSICKYLDIDFEEMFKDFNGDDKIKMDRMKKNTL